MLCTKIFEFSRVSRSHTYNTTVAVPAAEERVPIYSSVHALRARFRALVFIDFYKLGLDPTLFSFAYVLLVNILNGDIKKSQQRSASASKMGIFGETWDERYARKKTRNLVQSIELILCDMGTRVL